jgi:hypothetical protein
LPYLAEAVLVGAVVRKAAHFISEVMKDEHHVNVPEFI